MRNSTRENFNKGKFRRSGRNMAKLETGRRVVRRVEGCWMEKVGQILSVTGGVQLIITGKEIPQ